MILLSTQEFRDKMLDARFVRTSTHFGMLMGVRYMVMNPPPLKMVMELFDEITSDLGYKFNADCRATRL